MPAEAKTFRTKDEREFTFLFDIEGLIAAENCANQGNDENAGLKQIITGAANGRLGYLVALAYGGLKAYHPDITRTSAWALIDTDGTALGKAMWPALFAAMPEEKGNPPKAGSGNGTRSSPLGSKKVSRKRGSGSRPPAGSPSS